MVRKKKGTSNYRWIVGGELCLVLNHLGLLCAWDCATANVSDTSFQRLVRSFQDQMVILADPAFHATEGDPANLKLCRRGDWNECMLVQTVLSMLTLVCHFTNSPIGSGTTSALVWLSPWLPSISWCNGMASSQMRKGMFT